MEKVVSVDPGLTTGIATRILGKYNTAEVSGYPRVWDLIATYAWDLVICEDFVAQEISKYGITTTKIIGGIEAICHLKSTPFITHTAGQRIPYIARADTRIVKIHGKKMPRDHRQSAMAHLILWELKNV